MNTRPKTLAALGSNAVLGVTYILGAIAGLVMRIVDLITGKRADFFEGIEDERRKK